MLLEVVHEAVRLGPATHASAVAAHASTVAGHASSVAGHTSKAVTEARTQMGVTLGFHIVLASFGVAFPGVVLCAHWRGLRRGDAEALLLARRWSKVMGVLVAVGAVTGTVLSFEMGTLWPGLMGRFGPAIGVPFAIEGIFFLLEAVFTSIYLFGWRRLRPWAHFWTGVPVVVSGALGALAVVGANSWMNQPGGFTMVDGRITSVDPWGVVFNAASWYEIPHMILAAYVVVGFLVAAVYAVGMLRGRRSRYHRLGLTIPLVVAAIATPIQLVVGDTAARAVAKQQPIKFAAMEYVQRTHRGVTEYFGGVLQHGHVRFGIGVPDLDSILVGFSPHTKVVGLDTVQPAYRPKLLWLIHLSFDAMVGLGTALMVVVLWLAWSAWRRRRLPGSRLFLYATALCGPAAVIALECGWIVTEEGRQPWVVYHYLTVAQAATSATAVPASLGIVIALYAVIGVVTIGVIAAMASRWRVTELGEHEVPYGPARSSIGPDGADPGRREEEVAPT